ncbi:hypothetical protein EON62_02655 [archaeon]|nr:MAG: hypothetical protein EON62_02655 [archaeon]
MLQSPEEEALHDYRTRVGEFARSNNLAGALELYDDMIARNFRPTAYMFNTILSVCTRTTGGVDRPLVEKAQRLFDDMVRTTQKPNEAAFTSIIRICALVGDAPAAKTYFDRMISEGATPRLRTYTPLLTAFADAGDRATVLSLFQDLKARHIPPTQTEYAILLSMHARTGAWEDGFALLTEMMDSVYELEPAMESAVRAFFTAAPGWTCDESGVTKEDGTVAATGARLRSLELDIADHAALMNQVESLANSAPKPFTAYKEWLASRPPFDVIVDGANVGFFNQNFAGGALMYSQIEAVVRAFEKQDKRVLLVLSKRWLDAAQISQAAARKPQHKKRPRGRRPAPAASNDATAALVPPVEGAAASSAAGTTSADRSSLPAAALATYGVAVRAEDMADVPPTVGADATAATTSASTGSACAVEAESDGEEEAAAGLPDGYVATSAALDSSMAPRIVERWESRGIVYRIAPGSNDDWYWLYAALVHPRPSVPRLVSNDLMRDHHFQMLAPRSFLQWRERHQTNFRFEFNTEAKTFVPVFRAPRPYSHRMQPSADGDAWYFPLQGNSDRWLAAWQPARHATPSRAAVGAKPTV